ncbi:MAG: hypothetical protein CFE24_12095 [Flavobacterium sp. BFFFF2]|nr:MAG: hypothetical protein CFE24_12095 [Flavobacterium sp. BFFFF2]
MEITNQIEAYLNSQPEPKQTELRALDQRIHRLMPHCEQWFFDGKNDAGKQVTHPTIGYGNFTITYKDGHTKAIFRIGLLATTSGLAVYLMGYEDKKFLAATYGPTIGKAKVGTYGITFKSVNDIHLEVLDAAIQHRAEAVN